MGRRLWWVVLLMGCSRPGGEARATPGDGGRALLAPRRVLPPCRAAGDPGCSTACLQQGDVCLHRSASFREPPAELYYNTSTTTRGPCPDDCRVYDPCQRKMEAAGRNMTKQPECDCEHAPPAIDPCSSWGCECHCHSVALFKAGCPELAASLGF